jgi:O-antigen ligase/polysaccharide polymerase Wzy-like membrane protein
MPEKTQKQPKSPTLAGVVQSLLLAITALIPFTYVGVQKGYIEGYSTLYTVPKFYLLEALIAVAFVLWSALRRPVWADIRYAWALLAVLGLSILSAAWALLPTLAIVIASHYVIAFLFFLMLSVELRESRFLNRFVAVLSITVVIQAVWGITQFVVGHDLGLQWLGENVLDTSSDLIGVIGPNRQLRAYGSLPHTNVLAALLSTGTIVLVSVLFRRANRSLGRQIALGLPLGIIGAAFVVTFSRTAWAAGLAAVMALVIFAYRRQRFLPFGLAILVASVIGTAWGVSPVLTKRASVDDAVNVGVADRWVQYRVASDEIRDQPWGVGAGNYSPVADDQHPELTPYERQPVHNLLFLIASELGLAGAALAVWFAFRVTRRALAARIRDSEADIFRFGMVALWLAALTMGVTDHFWLTLPHGLWLFAIITALLVSRIPGRRLS